MCAVSKTPERTWPQSTMARIAEGVTRLRVSLLQRLGLDYRGSASSKSSNQDRPDRPFTRRSLNFWVKEEVFAEPVSILFYMKTWYAEFKCGRRWQRLMCSPASTGARAITNAAEHFRGAKIAPKIRARSH